MAPPQFTELESERLLTVAHELACSAGVLRLSEYLFVPAPALLDLLTRRRAFRRLLVDRMAVARGVTFDELYPQSDPSPLVELSKRFPNACECVWIARMSGVGEEILTRFIEEISVASADETTLAWTTRLRTSIEAAAPRTYGLELPDGTQLGVLACARLDVGLRLFPERARDVLVICELTFSPAVVDALAGWREQLCADDLAALDAHLTAYWSQWRGALDPASLPAGEAPAMSLGEYASVCAALEARPADAYAIFLTHGLAEPHTRQAVRDSWTARFEAHPHERDAFERLYSAALTEERRRPG